MFIRLSHLIRAVSPAIILSLAMFAAQQCDHASHAHGPMDGHSHGLARLDLALESNGALHAEFTIPGETLYGFEHRAKTAKDKRRVKDALARLTRDFTRLTQFPSEANCAIAWRKPALRETSGHAEVVAEFKAGCAKLGPGSRLRFQLSQSMPRLNKLVVRVLSDGDARILTLEKGDGEITL